MEMKENILENIGEEIKDVLYGYVKTASISYTEAEKDAEKYFVEYFQGLPYFQKHPEYVGTYSIKEDPFGRAACYAMVRGTGPKTVVLIHHNDVVPVEDFKWLKRYAFTPDELYEELVNNAVEFEGDAREDLKSGEWLYGRGVCDMKGGGSIQMALLNRYSQLEEFTGNVIVLAVPDEENLSAGMRAGVELLDKLKEKYGLEFEMMINSEPHQRKTPEHGVFSIGSIGKLMPFVYVRGCLAHAGKVFEGFNPMNAMSGIVRKTEINMELSDLVAGEAAPPPTWLYCKDSKEAYDVSMPLVAKGCLSILTLDSTPQMIMPKIERICKEAFDEVLEDMNRNYGMFLKRMNREAKPLPWTAKVMEFSELKAEAEAEFGELFLKDYEETIEAIRARLNANEISLIDGNFELVNLVYDYISDLSPRIIYGLIPPYYPSVANILLDEQKTLVQNFPEVLNSYIQEKYGQDYIVEHFYTGISDLSYCALKDSKQMRESLENGMPLFGEIYDLPLEIIEKNTMPCINIGPWGKDFHKLSERVFKEDLYERTPSILNYAIEKILGE